MHVINNKCATVFDVAERAGVSRGTVDRVLHERGRVSQKTREKVHKAIAELNYTPNANASKLASRKAYRFACLIPDFKRGDYWDEMNKGFLAAAKDYSAGSIDLSIHYYDQTRVETFIEESRVVLDAKPSGVIMNAVFREEVAHFTKDLEKAGIPYAFVDNKIDESDYTLYYGTDPYKSGALGAYLLTNRTDVKEVALVRLLRDPGHKADPNRHRRHGFTDYMEEHFPKCTIHTVFIDPENAEKTMEVLETFFVRNPSVRHVVMISSRVFLLGDYLRKHPDPERIVVGFDDLEKNLACLKEGLMDILVTRHIPQQAYDAFITFAECIIHNKQPAKKEHFVHMDILTRMNLDGY